MAQSDMFLKIDGLRQGPIKGESRDGAHQDEIDVISWNWGMEGNVLHGQAGGKMSLRELKVMKKVDIATTALMGALRSNEVIKKAVLTVRKAGGKDPVEYYTITAEKGRVTSLIQFSGGDEPATLNEELSLTFSKVSVQYKPQGDDGQFRGGTAFEMDLFEGA